MAHIVDRWYRAVAGPDGKSRQEPKPECGQGLRYRVRYTAPDGKDDHLALTSSRRVRDLRKRRDLAAELRK